jgi:hypothetical protein
MFPIKFDALLVATLGLSGAASVFACSDSEARQCNVGSECASGQCTATGTCVPMSPSQPDGSIKDDAATTPGDAGTADTSSSDATSCAFSGGQITRADVPIRAGLRANFRRAQNVNIDTVGTIDGAGKRMWDFSAMLTGDQTTVIETLSPAGTWYAAKFPAATYASKLGSATELLGVFEAGPGALTLLGVVSPTDALLSKTELTYSPAAEILNFPLEKGKKWTNTSNITGTFQGVAGYFYTERYESEVDAEGTLKTPLGSFGVVRVNTKLTKTLGVIATVTRSHAFVTKCFGTIATVRSRDNETDVEFAQASEISRISL